MFLKYGGGIAGMLGLFAAVSAATGMKFQFGSAGSGGVPLTGSWLGAGILLAVGALCWWLGTRWDAPGFADFRKRRRWVVPVVVGFVVFPATVILLFAMLQ